MTRSLSFQEEFKPYKAKCRDFFCPAHFHAMATLVTLFTILWFTVVVFREKLATLFECLEIRRELSGTGIGEKEYEASLAIQGGLIADVGDECIESATFEITHLSGWLGHKGFDQDFPSPQVKPGDKFVLRYAFPDAPEADIGVGTLKICPSLATGGDHLTEVTLNQGAVVVVDLREPCSLDFLFNEISMPLQQFLTLAVGSPVHITGITFQARIDDAGQSGQANLCKLFSPQQVPRDNTEETPPWRMFFCLREISDEFSEIIPRWFERRELLKPMFDLYSSSVANDRPALTSQFLNLAHGLETFHRRTRDANYLDGERFDDLRSKLKKILRESDVDDPARSVFMSRIGYLNEFSLSSRLKELVDSLGDIAQILIRDRDKFCRSVVDTRNFLTHHNPALEAQSAVGKDLWLLVEKLRFITEVLFLREIGISSGKVEKLTRKYQRYIHVNASEYAPSYVTIDGNRE